MHSPHVHSPSPPVGFVSMLGAAGFAPNPVKPDAGAPKDRPLAAGAAVGLKPVEAAGLLPNEKPPLVDPPLGVNPPEGVVEGALAGFPNEKPPDGADGGADEGLPKEKPPVGAEGAAGAALDAVAAAPGLGLSQMVHLTVAEAGFFNMHTSHSHSPSAAAGFGMENAGAEGADAGAAPARGVSQIVHFCVALAGFFNMHVSHSHSPFAAAAGLGIENAGADGTGAGAAPALGVSQTVHFLVALAGFFNMHVSHSHSPSLAAGTWILKTEVVAAADGAGTTAFDTFDSSLVRVV